MQRFTDIAAQGFENINQRMENVEHRLQAVELRKEISYSKALQEQKHDQMDLVLVNFQQPAYLNRKMKQYCVSKSLSIRNFLNDLIASEIIKELKI
jgi:BarA-like signal transduction histidine kinase